MFYDKSIDSIYEEFGSGEAGLSDEQVGKNRDTFGANALREKKKKSVAAVFLSQFKDLLVIILIIAAAISFATGSAESSLVIILVLILNAVLGTVQSIKADKSLESLKKLSSPMAKVTRRGEDMEIDASELVCGDIIRLEAGDIVPADARIISCHSFKTNESALTGESEPVDKTAKSLGGFTEKDISPDALANANHGSEKNVFSSELADANHEKNTYFSGSPEILALGDQKNMVFSSSLVTNGRAIAIVTAVGTSSELGKIAEDLNTAAQRKTPLQVTMDNFSKKLSIGILVICAVVFTLTVYRGGAVADALLFAIALAVAAIPEALSSIITISLAIGTTRMAKENAIVKNLSAVEGLGSVSVICSDKTGTLTQNKMTVTDLWCLNTNTSISEIDSSCNNSADTDKHSRSEKLLELAAVLCNDSTLVDGQLTGDPTETALISYYEKLCNGEFHDPGMNPSQCAETSVSDMNPSQYAKVSGSDANHLQYAKAFGSDVGYSSPWKLRDRFPRVGELPFDSDRKLMSTLNIVNTQTGTENISQADSSKGIGTKSFSAADSPNGIGRRILMFTKGAPDVVLGRAAGLSEADKARILAANEAFSRRGLRVLAFAYKDFGNGSSYTDSIMAPAMSESPDEIVCDNPNSADTSDTGNPKLSTDDENDLIFLGLIAMMDPPRTESAAAVADCIKAGIKPIMITGDHKVTAAAIAKEIGILRKDTTDVGAGVGGAQGDSGGAQASVARDAQADSGSAQANASGAQLGAGKDISPNGLAEANSAALDDTGGAQQSVARGAQAGAVVTGVELDRMSDEELEKELPNISVFARVSPSNKIRIVNALQSQAHIVAMTGDGVNDAPALKSADVGIAMGVTGTEVAKDAASIILTDDNFATIIKAVLNGRNIYANIKNSIQFLLSGNAAGIIAVLFASLAGLPAPFTSVQLLFINLVTDSLPALAIGMEPSNPALINEKPRPRNESVLTGDTMKQIGWQGALIALATMTAFYLGLTFGATTASTMAFATLCLARLWHGFNCRGRESIFRLGLWTNRFMLLAFAIGFVLLLAVLLTPAVAGAFSIAALNGRSLFRILCLSIAPTIVIQISKIIQGRD